MKTVTHSSRYIKLNVIASCWYCNELASGFDHVVPYSYSKNETQLVSCCTECNCLLSNKIFKDLEAKCSYIANRLRRRYKHNIESVKIRINWALKQATKQLKIEEIEPIAEESKVIKIRTYRKTGKYKKDYPKENKARKGILNPKSVLTELQVLEIREKYVLEENTQKELAEIYGVRQCTISKIIRGQCWKHLVF